MITALTILSVCFVCTVGYPSGAPVTACPRLAPIHLGTTPQTSTCPYNIEIDSSEWQSSGAMKVTITGNDFAGFLLQGKQAGSGDGVGMFDLTMLPEGSQAGPCSMESVYSSVTHTNPDKKGPLTFMWTMPAVTTYTGEVYIQGAIAQSHDIYWVNVTSKSFSTEFYKEFEGMWDATPDNETTTTTNHTHEMTTDGNMTSTTHMTTTKDMTTTEDMTTTKDMTTTAGMKTSDKKTESTTDNLSTTSAGSTAIINVFLLYIAASLLCSIK